MSSSIIFLVVVGIWAAFLLPDLQLRRHRLAQSRAAETISESARILKRSNRSGKSSDAGVTADQPRAAPIQDRRRAEEGPASSPVGLGGLSRAIRTTWCAVAILAVLAVPVTAALAVFSVLSWQPAMVTAGLVVLVLTGLRLRARHVSRSGRRREARFPRSQAGGVMVKSGPQAQVTDEGAAVVAIAVESSAPEPDARRANEQAAVARAGRRDVAFDLAAFDTLADSTQPAPRSGEWTPRPVPAPSYLSKPSLPDASQRGQLLDARPHEDPFADLLKDGGGDAGAQAV